MRMRLLAYVQVMKAMMAASEPYISWVRLGWAR